MLLPVYLESDLERVPWVTYCIMAVNGLIFLLLEFLPEHQAVTVMYRFGLVPEDPGITAVFTAMFLHASWLHILSNMYFLWIFGRAVEDALGPVKYLLFYLTAGIVSMLIHMAAVVPEIADVTCLGASGAISGVLGAFLVMFPGARVWCVAFLFEFRPVSVTKVPAYIVLGIWFFLQLIMQWMLGGATNSTAVAYAAHIGGFLFGWLLIGAAGALRSVRQEWGALLWIAGLRGKIAHLSTGENLSDQDRDDIIIQKMLFLKHGEIPERNELLTQWIGELDVQKDKPLIASLVLRADISGLAGTLDVNAVTRGARALLGLGHLRCAVVLLIGKLCIVSGQEAQKILYEIGNSIMHEDGLAAVGGPLPGRQ